VAVVLVAAQAGGALGGSPLAAPERRPAVSEATGTVRYVVEPGDSLWSIAEVLAPGEDPRPVVDALAEARRGAPLIPGETIIWAE
jgi:Tfp pilus assembly protein FimV